MASVGRITLQFTSNIKRDVGSYLQNFGKPETETS